MKLSDVKGDRVFDVIAALIDPIAAIAGDKDVAEMLKRRKPPDGVDAKAFLLDRLRKSIPGLLLTHKADIITILAAIEGTSPQAYANALDMGKLVHDLYDLLTDEAFGSLFTSAQSGTSSGSAPETTADRSA